VESVETARDRILLAAKYIPIEQLGTTDDCGFSPFSDDIATNRRTAFKKLQPVSKELNKHLIILASNQLSQGVK